MEALSDLTLCSASGESFWRSHRVSPVSAFLPKHLLFLYSFLTSLAGFEADLFAFLLHAVSRWAAEGEICFAHDLI